MPKLERAHVGERGPGRPIAVDRPGQQCGYPWLEIRCSRCKTPRAVDLAALPHVATTCVHDLAGRLRCAKCRKADRRPAAELLQLAPRERAFP